MQELVNKNIYFMIFKNKTTTKIRINSAKLILLYLIYKLRSYLCAINNINLLDCKNVINYMS